MWALLKADAGVKNKMKLKFSMFGGFFAFFEGKWIKMSAEPRVCDHDL